MRGKSRFARAKPTSQDTAFVEGFGAERVDACHCTYCQQRTGDALRLAIELTARRFDACRSCHD
jgi:hypothetical protein